MYIRCSQAYFRAMQNRVRTLFYVRLNNARGIQLKSYGMQLWINFAHPELDHSILTGKGYHLPCTEEKELEVAAEAQKTPEMKVNIKGKSGLDAVLGLRVFETTINEALGRCVSGRNGWSHQYIYWLQDIISFV
uniref:Uncharacterized protein n=1 Tax=Wuchereria bancrofti TaxID=6293 RepID=A0AAF5Q7A4_WUCBA